MKSEFITAANKDRYDEGLKAFAALRNLCRDPMKRNCELLFKIIRDNENTEYGKKYDFKNIKSIEDFQAKVPVSQYSDYAAYTNRMAQNSEKNILCSYPVNHYNVTSGTTGIVKFIPMSDYMVEAYKKYVTRNSIGVISDAIGDSWTGGRSVRLIEGTSDEHYLPCGATYGAITSKMTGNFRQKIDSLFTSPEEAVFPESGTNTRYLHARFALMDEDATGFQVIYLSYLLVLFEYIENNWEMLVNDIKNGTIDSSVEISPVSMGSLMKKIRPMPERAEVLRDIFSGGFSEPFVPKVWKNMKYIIGVGTGGFKDYADQIHDRYTTDAIPFMKFGIVASEGCFTTSYRLNSEDTVLIPDSVFFEFLPLDAEEDFSKIVTIEGLEAGKDYEIIITNTGGLYRYRMRDAVRVVSKFENTPTVEYLYRIDQTVSMLGERATEADIRTAVNNTADALSLKVVDFSVYADIKAVPPRYQFFLELKEEEDEENRDEVRLRLEEELCKVNPTMGHMISKGVCQSIRVNFLQKETYALWRDLAIYHGASSNQLKPLHIIRAENQRKFFFAMTEYSSEPPK